MAQSAVACVLQSLSSLIASEVKLIAGLPEDIRAIKSELQSILAVLEIAEETAERDVTVKQWVKEVQILAYDIEDVVEEYLLFQKESRLRQISQYLKLNVRNMADTIKTIRGRAVDIARRRDAYRVNNDISEHGSCTSQGIQPTLSSLCITKEFDLVGAETPKGEIMKFLALDEIGSRNTVIAVVGMSGLGKTTIVGNIYNDRTVRDYFPIYAWISASRPCCRLHILRSMMKQFYEAARETEQLCKSAGLFRHSHSDALGPCDLDNISTMDERSLLSLLKIYFQEKRYMVVIDNVQEGDTDLSIYVKNVLPSNDMGSRILITTQYESVARAWVHGSHLAPYKLQPLSSDKAWDLFCKKTFENNEGRCPPELCNLARDIVDKCQGLPIAILGMGRLLSIKQNSLSEWKKVHHSLGFYLKNDYQLSGIKQRLIHTYHNLPCYLKPCFLYFGLFPENYIIGRMRLIRLWIAEGFITQTPGNLTLEEVAEDYLSKLVDTSMIEVPWTDPTGKHRGFRVHDLMREIILSKLEELSFCKILSKRDSSVDGQPRRLSIHKDYNCSRSNPPERSNSAKSGIRTVLLIDVAQDVPPKVLDPGFLKSLMLLRILDLQYAPIDVVPNVIGELRNLYYLSLRNTKVRVLPGSIGKLQNLQTLDLKFTPIHKLPEEVSELQKLRHLLMYSYDFDHSFSLHTMKTRGVQIPKEALVKLVELQKLAFFDVGKGLRLHELKNLTQLRRLGIVNLCSNDCGALCIAIQYMNCLQVLNVLSKNKGEVIDLRHVCSFPPLQHLYLNGRLTALPTWISKVDSLVKVRLRWSRLQDDPFEILKQLPNLVEVKLLEAFDGKSLRFANGGFKKLKILHLLDLHYLETLSIREGALPVLEELSIGDSLRLELPYGFQHLRSLKILEFYGMPSSFTDSIRPGEQCYSLVEHVPNVYFHYANGQGGWQTYTLR